MGAGSEVTGGLLAIAGPVGTGLGVQAWGGVLIALRHVRVRRRIRRILAVCGICRAGTCNGRIYRQRGVRFGVNWLKSCMTAAIWKRHGRTCWCLRHSPVGTIRGAGRVVGTLHVGEGAGPRGGRVDAVFRGGSGRVGVASCPRLWLRRVGSGGRGRIYRFRLRLRVADDTGMGRRQT